MAKPRSITRTEDDLVVEVRIPATTKTTIVYYDDKPICTAGPTIPPSNKGAKK